jgi:hypothetical protein
MVSPILSNQIILVLFQDTKAILEASAIKTHQVLLRALQGLLNHLGRIRTSMNALVSPFKVLLGPILELLGNPPIA